MANRQDSSHSSQLSTLRGLSQWLDEAFEVPGTRFRVGWDGVLGLIPGIGDLFTSALSLFIIFQSLKMNIPGSVAARMVGNVLIENVVGAVPLIGDLFDFVWKSNKRNVDLLTRYVEDPRGTSKRSGGVIVLWAVGLLLLFVLLVAVPLYLLYLLVGAMLH